MNIKCRRCGQVFQSPMSWWFTEELPCGACREITSRIAPFVFMFILTVILFIGCMLYFAPGK